MTAHEEENLRGQLSDLAYRLEKEQAAHASTKTQLADTQSELAGAKKAKGDTDAALAKVGDGLSQLRQLIESVGLLTVAEAVRKAQDRAEAEARMRKAQEDLDALSK